MIDSRNPASLDSSDGVRLEVGWNRLASIADESARAMLRTAFSTIIRESNETPSC